MNRITLWLCTYLYSAACFAQLRNPGNLPYHWVTDTSRHTVELADLTVVTTRDAVAILNYPEFISGKSKDNNYADFEPVIAVSLNGETKAYPVSEISLFELANDSIGHQQVMVTFCPLCNSGLVFQSKFKNDSGEFSLNFSISGMLLNDDMIMYDRLSESWWDVHLGEAIVGKFAGTELKLLRAEILTAKDYFIKFPDGKILSPHGSTLPDKKLTEGFYAKKGNNNPENPSQPQKTNGSDLGPMDEVLDVNVMDHSLIYPVRDVANLQVLNQTHNNMHFVIFCKGDSSSNSNSVTGKSFRRTAMVYRSNVNNTDYLFRGGCGVFYDDKTSSAWDYSGNCISGPLKGKQLMYLPHSNHFAYAYLTFFPWTSIFKL